MKKTLTFSKNFSALDFSYPSIYLGSSRSSNNSNILYDEYFPNIEDKIKGHDFCQKIYNSLILDLSKDLNTFHKLDYPIRSWNIILGSWLRTFIHKVYENYYILDKVFKNYEIEEIFAFHPEEYDLYTFNCLSLEFALVNEDWNCALNSKIINFLDLEKKVIFKKSNENFLFNQIKTHTPKRGVVFKILNLIGIFCNYLKKNKYACIYKTNLSLISEKKLEIKMGQLPQFFGDEKEISFRPFDKNLRKNISLKNLSSESKFEEFIRMILPLSLPNFVLESFKKINTLSEKSIFPKSPKIIFTSEAFLYDDIFKFYAAKRVQDGVPYFIGQHGNCYFTHAHNNYAPEMTTGDKFLSWGVKGNKNIVPICNLKIIGKSKLFNNNGKFLAVFPPFAIAGQPMFDVPAHEKGSYESGIKILSKLGKKIKSQTLARLFATYRYESEPVYHEQIKKLNINIDDGNRTMRFLLKKSRLSFFTYDCTGILENLALNIPTVCYWDNTFGFINPRFVDVYKLLIKAKILFEDSDDLVKHIENNWLDINKWWMSANTQNCIKEFNSKINIPPQEHSLDYLKKVLNKEVRL